VTEKSPSRDELATADERGRYRVQPEWIGLATIINVGLIVLCIYVVSSLIGAPATDAPYRVAIVSLVVAMPLLAFMSILTEVQRTRRYASYPWYMIVTQSIAQVAAVLGFAAALWRAWWPASVALAVSGVVGLLVFQAYYRRLEKDNEPDVKRRRGRKADQTHADHGG
jgi:O-antigen/teichoic acid export membrane protein